jgi:hypothetical protein
MEPEHRSANERLKRELAIGSAGLAFGLFILPAAIYWVGTRIFGDYSADGGMAALAEQFWSDLLGLEPAAWVLLLSPYVIVQLGRVVRRLWRSEPV